MSDKRGVHDEPLEAKKELGLLTKHISQAVRRLEALTADKNLPSLAAEADGPQLEKIRRVRGYLRARRLRERLLPTDLFGEPAWDMLLDLYAADLEKKDVSISSACIAASVPATTALRWLNRLIACGLVARVNDQSDARRAYVRLSPSGRNAIEVWIEETCARSSLPSLPEPIFDAR